MYQKIVDRLNNISFVIIAGICAFLPIIFIPESLGGFMVKGFVLHTAVFLAFSIWLIGQFIAGSLKIPKSPSLLALGFWVLLSLTSALTSANPAISLWGTGFVFDSFSTSLVLSLFVFLIAVFASEKKQLIKLFLSTFCGAVFTIFLQFILYIFQKTPFISKYFVHVSTQGTLVGSWVDFSYFVTFVFLLALLIYEILTPKGMFKILSLFTIFFSLTTLVFLNFKPSLIAVILSSLIVFVYKSSVERSLENKIKENLKVSNKISNNFPLISLISLLVGLFFFLTINTIGASVSKFTGISFSDIRPSFSVTTKVMRQSLYKDPLFGFGPGKYKDAWNLYRPANVNETIFWNSPFDSGFSTIQSLITTNGLIPVTIFAVVLFLSLINGFNLFKYKSPDRFIRFINITSLIMILVLIFLLFFSSPSITVIIFSFIYVGLLLGVSSILGKTKFISLEYLKDPRISFFAILLIVLLIMTGFSAVYFTSNKFTSIVYYNKALTASDFTEAQRNIDSAINFSQNDIYFRTRTSIFVNQFSYLAQNQNSEKAVLQNLFNQAEQSAQASVTLNRSSANNWFLLSQVYQLITDSNNIDALKKVKDSALEAQKRSPNNPLYILNDARIALIEQDTAKAISEIDRALSLKSNYLDAFILRGQIKQAQGESQAIKNELIKYTTVAPFDSQGFLLLGNAYIDLKNYNLALEAFARVKILEPNNPNIYLPYIQVLEMSGQRNRAIEELKFLQNRFPKLKGIEEQIIRIEKNNSNTETLEVSEE